MERGAFDPRWVAPPLPEDPVHRGWSHLRASIPWAIAFAVVTGSGVADDSVQRWEARFDGEVTVTPEMTVSIDRGGRTWSTASGEILDADAADFDVARAGGLLGPWREVDTPLVAASAVASGWSRDQSERRTAIYDRSRGRLGIWRGDRVRGGPDLEIDCRRTIGDRVVFDVLVDTPFERPDVTHRVASATMLPGCLLMLLERSSVDAAGEVVGVDGVSVAALQEGVDGTWDWSWMEDMPDPPLADAREFSRGSLSSMASYFPTTRDEGFLEAFVPLVDYINHRSDARAPGGQCGIFRATRASVGDVWSFGPLVEIARSWGIVGEHFHVAGWTPNGVVLAVGDSELSRVSLLRCADWDHYDIEKNWTEIPRWQGTLPDGRLVSCNQFWSCCAGNHEKELLVGGDNVTGSVFTVDVPETGTEPPVFRRLIGDQGSRLVDGETANTVSWMVRDRPEIGGVVLGRQVLDGGNSPLYSRVLQSVDGESFAAVARGPREMDRLAVPFFAGEEIGLMRFNTSGDPEVHVATPVSELPTARGLIVRPGGYDLLRDESGVHREPDSMSPAASIAVERLSPEIASTLSDRILPPDAVCYRVSGTTTDVSTRLFTAGFLDSRTEAETAPGQVAVVAHVEVCNLLSSKLRLRFELTRGPAFTEKTITIASQGDWHDVDVWSYRTSLPADVQLRVDNRGGGTTGTVDFLLIHRSMTLGSSSPAWHLDPAPSRFVPGDEVDIGLPIRTDDWRLDLELMLPPDGTDYSSASNVPAMPLFTLFDDRGGRLAVEMKPPVGEVRFYSGVDRRLVGRISQLQANRGDLIRLRFERTGSTIRAMARISGDLDESPATVTLLASPQRPRLMRLGGAEHELVSSLILRRVTVETPTRGREPVLLPEPGIAGDAPEGGRRGAAPAVGGERIFQILSRFGAAVESDEREVDLDGDGLVSLLDLQMAIRLARSAALTPPRPPARGR